MKKKTYHIITIGCAMNKSDSERIASFLEKHEYKNTERKDAELVILTTCGVRQSAEDRIYGLVPTIKKENKEAKIIITGCLSERKDVIKRLKNKVDLWVPIKNFPSLLQQAGIIGARQSEKDYLEIEAKYNSNFQAFIPIGNGCDNFCAYCVVPFARGREVYREAEDILKEVEYLAKKNYKEITLIAQNVNSYRSKSGFDFADLLKAASELPGDFWIRFSTSHPKDMSNKLIKTISKSDKICNHIHLPAQAGDNTVLENMNRGYTIEHYKSLIKKIKKEVPGVAITTDIIVGFPSENGEQFQKSIELFRKIKFDMAYISQYSSRPGTAAAKLKDNVSKKEKIKREKELTKILTNTALENNKKYIDKILQILVEGKNKDGNFFGKTATSKNVRINFENKVNPKIKIGDFGKVKIKKAQNFGLSGDWV